MPRGQSDVFIEAMRPLLENKATTEDIALACFKQFAYNPHPVTIRRWRKKLGCYAPSPVYVKAQSKVRWQMEPQELASIELYGKLQSLWRSVPTVEG